MKILCPSCARIILGADIDIGGGRALCRTCGELMTLDEAVDNVTALVPAVQHALTTSTPSFRPNSLHISESSEGRLRLLEVRPSRVSAIPLLGFAAIWNAFLVLWYSMALGIGHGGPANLLFWFPLLHVGVGLIITWQGMTRLCNRTLLSLDDRELTVKQLPLPGPRVSEATGNILRFEAGLGAAFLSGARGQVPSQWIVKALTADGRAIDLPMELGAQDQAAHVAHRLNRLLDEVRAPLTYRE